MAVLEVAPGVEVCITSRKQKLREYEDPYADVTPKYAAHYIEAPSNAPFEVRTCFTSPFPNDRAVEIGISVDGRTMDELVVRPHELFARGFHTSEGPISDDQDRWSLQRYRFAPLRIRKFRGRSVLSITTYQSPDEADTRTLSTDLARELEAMGSITVTLHFLKYFQLNRGTQSPRKIIKKFDPINEKDVKGNSLGKAKSIEEVEYLDVEQDDNGEAFATFQFHYRSLAALKDLHIVERTPDPMDLFNSDEGALAQMNREQLQAIVRRMRERDHARLRTKRERSESTLAGDDAGAGRGETGEEPDFVETGCVDLRAKRRMIGVREMRESESESRSRCRCVG
ncbi:hypothetical protein T440DRAFT_534575 [Plenodomus tracheiphilus IPT5]|uniref:DUF7918 domain-containing protein n=1 Tax=Plenodomus tracheiphilus IPT5 TaxID=1408161 RepID=A0A6A7B3X4_9PLEO|nr:hypothetical protein T440DRAFT_534575 [Plenodomus tracheiphilus IPT5]